MSDFVISVVGYNTEQTDMMSTNNTDEIQSKGFSLSRDEDNEMSLRRLLKRDLDASLLKENLSKFCSGMTEIFDEIVSPMHNYCLDEIELQVEISLSGGISLIGSAEAGMNSGITLKFKRDSYEN